MGYDISYELMENISYLQDDLATTISVTDTIAEYLETSETVVFPSAVQQIILQNTLLWAQSNSVNIRWNSTRILLDLLRSTESKGIINHQLIRLVDMESLYIKNLIMRNLYQCKNIDDKTKDYIIQKCHTDPCFMVRMVCKEETEKEIQADGL